MGTNFYAKRLPTKQEHDYLLKLFKEKQYDLFHEKFQEYFPKYHIGKRSGGWQFLFSPHKSKNSWEEEMPWENTLESIKEFLNKDNIEIVDEYGDKFTPEQFWNEKVGEALYNDPKKYINLKQYYEQEPPIYKCKAEDYEFITKEGLRFSTTSEFS